MSDDNSRMSALPAEQKPREKAMALGMKALTDVELMAIIFGTGVQGKDVIALCREILADNRGSLAQVAAMSASEFMSRYKGIGPAKALTLLAGLELGVRAASEAIRSADPQIDSAAKAYDYMLPWLFPDFVNAYPKNHLRTEVQCVDAVS